MRTLRAHLAEIALIVGCVSILLSALLFKFNNDQGQDIKDAVNEIQQSRVVLSKQSCRQRNNERAVQRSNLRENLQNLARISDSALEQLGFTREQAVAQIRKQLKQVAPLDCKKLVRQVAGTRSGKPKKLGGGQGPSRAPRPQPSRGASKGRTGAGGGSGAFVPERPSEGGGIRPEPPPGNGKPPVGNPSSPQQPTQPDQPVIPHPDPGSVVQQIKDRVQTVVQQILPP